MRALILGLVMSVVCFGQEPAVHAPVRVSGGVVAGNILTKVQPVFPEEARRQRIDGGIVMRVIVGTDGLVKNVQVISGPLLLRASCLDAVRQWTFRPYLLNGVPVEVDTTITIHVGMGGNER